MTTITKVFVILVSLFAIMFTVMTVQFAARTHNWRQLAENYRQAAETAQASQRNALAIAASEAEQCRDLQNREHQKVLDAQQQISSLQQQIDALTQEKNQLALARDNWEQSARTLTAQMEIATKHNQELSEAKEQALARERQLQAQNIQLNDRVKELSANLVVLTQQLNQRVEELTAFRNENEQLRQSAGLGRAGEPMTSTPTPSARASTPTATSPIQGSVTNVQGNLATVDVGSSSGVAEGMVMVVLRDGYVGDLEITSDITPTEAVGRIVRAEGKQVRPGDKVVDANSFESR